MRLWKLSVAGLMLWVMMIAPLSAASYHYQVDISSQLIEDEAGNLSGLKLSWLYDKSVSYLLFDSESITRSRQASTLARLGKQIVTDLEEYQYYAVLRVNGVEQAFARVTEHELVFTDDKRLQLDFALPLSQPAALAGSQLELEWLDPTGTGLLLYESADDLSLGTVKASCKVELENHPDYAHGELPQSASIDCR